MYIMSVNKTELSVHSKIRTDQLTYHNDVVVASLKERMIYCALTRETKKSLKSSEVLAVIVGIREVESSLGCYRITTAQTTRMR